MQNERPLDGGAAAEGAAEDSPPARTGHLVVQLRERAPLSSLAEVQRRIGYADADVSEADEDYQVTSEAFDLFVPSTCQPAAHCGLLVWIGSSNREVLLAGYEAVLSQQRMLWASARRSGNDRKVPVRINLALDVAAELAPQYNVDAQRVWVGGFSGGARSASKAALLYPEVFSGGLFVGAADYVHDIGPDSSGRRLPSGMPNPDMQKVARAKPHAFLLVSGETDPNHAAIAQIHHEYQRDAFARAGLRILPERGHEMPNETQFAEALTWLAGPRGY